ncbi:MAG: TonB-dependent receptor [Bacteroidota bacterium]
MILLLLCYQSLWGQATLKGTLTDTQGEPLGYAQIELLNTSNQSLTDNLGNFVFRDLPFAAYEVRATYLGYDTASFQVDLRQRSSLTIQITLISSVSLEEVVISEKSDVRILNEYPLAISAIDFSGIQNSSIDAAGKLDRVNGVRVRQSGGVGSEVNISIQGAQGNAVRRYFDGLPVRFLAAGLDLNTIPVNQIERIDVYRGITPLEVGTDALGGGINVIPKKFYRNQLDASYQVGSFNTHNASLNAFFINKQDVFIGTNLYLNSSDNTYRIDAHDYNVETRRAENIIQAERFNDAFRSYYGDVTAGVRDKPWAKSLKVSLLYNYLYDEVQTGIAFNLVRPAGDAFTTRSGVTGSLDYQVAFAEKRGEFHNRTHMGWYEDFIQDSTSRFYNWRGEVLPIFNTLGTDILANPAKITIDRVILLQRNTLKYQLTANQQLTASHMLINQDREGRNAFISDPEDDPFTLPALLQQQYGGIAWDAKWFSQKLQSVVTYKLYRLRARATSLEDAIDLDFEEKDAENTYSGANAGLKYAFHSNLYLRASYEYAYRLPEENELFGNQSTIRSNINLRPEQSDNYNLGAFYKFTPWKKIPVALEVNGFYRYQRDRIILLASGFDLAQFFNEEEVEIAGVDGYLSTKLFKSLVVNMSGTFQDIRIRSALVEADQDLIGTRLPNVPSLFLRMDASYTFESLLQKGDALAVTWLYDFTDEFSSVREADAVQNVGNFVPEQHVHSAEVIYTFAKERLNLSARVNNMFNDDLFDNFRIQRPGTHFFVKLRYRL